MPILNILNYSEILVASFLLSAIGCYFYPRFAYRFKIISIPNNRTLHALPTPRGAGVVIVIVLLGMLAFLYSKEILTDIELRNLLIGSLPITIIGFLDDRFNLSARLRLVVQILSAAWILYYISSDPWSLPFGFTQMPVAWWTYALLGFLIVWFYNVSNFIDGIDGMAGSATLFVSVTMGLFQWLGGDMAVSLPLLVLGCSSLGFLLINWPPAKVFLGDVGSYFIGYVFSALAIYSFIHSDISIWVWLILFAFYFSDTANTTITRIIKKPKTWYLTHRSHAYQNLARNWQSHKKMLLLVWCFNLGWALPLAIAAFVYPTLGWLFFLAAYIPSVAFAIKFGPLHEDL